MELAFEKLSAFEHAAELLFCRMLVAALSGFQGLYFLVVHREALELDDAQVERIAVMAVCVRIRFPDLSLLKFHGDEVMGTVTRKQLRISW